MAYFVSSWAYKQKATRSFSSFVYIDKYISTEVYQTSLYEIIIYLFQYS